MADSGQDPTGGPLHGLTVIEMAGLGPVPLAGLILAEMGADIVRIERTGRQAGFLPAEDAYDLDRHGRQILQVNLKSTAGRAVIARLASGADVLMEGFRPGTMERLGLGPDSLHADNPGLVYARMTGFGQEGPLAGRAGHDLTYLAMTGILHAIGPAEGRPVPPLNLVADYGGGTMFLIAGILAALIERGRSGRGQIVDAAMIDGASMLAAPFFGWMASGFWQDRRGVNLLDSGAPFYDTYETADNSHIAVACLEPQFFAEFAELLPLDPAFGKRQYDRECWPAMRAAIKARIAERSRDEWAEHFAGSDACVAPVLSLKEAPNHRHHMARQTHVERNGFLRPGPAPRFSRSPVKVSSPPVRNSAQTLARFGFEHAEIEHLIGDGVVED